MFSASPRRIAFAILTVLLLALLAAPAESDIPQDAQQAEDNSRRTGLLKRLAEEAERRGDWLACAAFSREVERIANVTDLLKQQVEAEFSQLPVDQQNQVRQHRESVIADAAITRADANAMRGCLRKAQMATAAIAGVLLFIFLLLFWRAFGPFFRARG